MSGLRQSQALLHSWSGLVVGWVLYTIFLTGTVSYWREDINRWMRPELGAPVAAEEAVTSAVAFLQKTAPDAGAWSIYPNASGAQVYWQPKSSDRSEGPRRRDTQALVGRNAAPLEARQTKGGEFFYRFHFDLYYAPVIWSRWFVGFCSMVMFVAILSGVITHKKIFADFFTFRRRKGQRTWLDGHNALAVLALPFHLMITYTGLVTLLTLYMPWAALANYDAERGYRDALAPGAPAVERSHEAAALVDLAPLMRDARAQWPGREIGSIKVEYPGDAASRVTLSPGASGSLSTRNPSITYSGSTGDMIWKTGAPVGAIQAYGVMVGLHTGRFAPDLVRWLYFLSGIAGTVMVGGGLVMWTVKRRAKLPDPLRPHFGFRVVERLNIGFVAGLPVAMAGFLWANRLLPIGLAERAEWEVHSMFILWGIAIVVAFTRPGKAAWTGLLGLCGAMLVGLAVYDFAGARGLLGAWTAGDGRMLAMSLAIPAIGCAFLLMARQTWMHRFRPRKDGTPSRAATGVR